MISRATYVHGTGWPTLREGRAWQRPSQTCPGRPIRRARRKRYVDSWWRSVKARRKRNKKIKGVGSRVYSWPVLRSYRCWVGIQLRDLRVVYRPEISRCQASSRPESRKALEFGLNSHTFNVGFIISRLTMLGITYNWMYFTIIPIHTRNGLFYTRQPYLLIFSHNHLSTAVTSPHLT